MKEPTALYSISDLQNMEEYVYKHAVANYTWQEEKRDRGCGDVVFELYSLPDYLQSLGYANLRLDCAVGDTDAYFRIEYADVDAAAVIRRLPATMLKPEQALAGLTGLKRYGTIEYCWDPTYSQVWFFNVVDEVCECENVKCHTDTCIAEQESTDALCMALHKAFVQDKERLEAKCLARLQFAWWGIPVERFW